MEIETLIRCNSTCSFCPVNKNADTREMDVELFLSILQQLKELNYTGSVGLYSNIEPFLDNRIVDLAKIVREQLPHNHLLRKLNDILSIRGGQAPNRNQETIEPLKYGCFQPFRQMFVRPDGKVSLCCDDALSFRSLPRSIT